MPDNGPKDATSITELKVAGHMMSLDPGLYCVFSAAGGPVPDASSGLPTVRISAAPGQRPGQVEVVGMDQGGWIGPDAATLVRVSGSRSDLLVTVYQAGGSAAEAPQLQVVRLSGVAATEKAAAPRAAAGEAGKPEVMDVIVHAYGRGDVGGRLNEWTGEPGSKLWIEGFGIAPSNGVPPGDLEYQAVLGRGWLSPWAEGGQFCGSRGMSLPILGLRVRLRGASAQTHRVVLSATFVDGTKVGPVQDGEACEAPSLAALEAIHVGFEAKGRGVAAAPVRETAKRGGKTPAPEPVVAIAPPVAKARTGKKASAVVEAAPAPEKGSPEKGGRGRVAKVAAPPEVRVEAKPAPVEAVPERAARGRAAKVAAPPAKPGSRKADAPASPAVEPVAERAKPGKAGRATARRR